MKKNSYERAMSYRDTETLENIQKEFLSKTTWESIAFYAKSYTEGGWNVFVNNLGDSIKAFLGFAEFIIAVPLLILALLSTPLFVVWKLIQRRWVYGLLVKELARRKVHVAQSTYSKEEPSEEHVYGSD